MKAAELKKLRPRMILKYIPDEASIENIVDTIVIQNEELQLNPDDIKIQFIINSKYKNEVRHAVIQVSPKARKILIANKIKLFYTILSVEDYISVKRCGKCSRFNHTTRNCQGNQACPLCSEAHSKQDCPGRDKPEEYVCVNCTSFNAHCKPSQKVATSHSSLDSHCPSYLSAINRLILNTDYTTN